MTRPTLLQIGERVQSGKWDAHSYLPVYDELFATFRDRPCTIVEIGIERGQSLLMWLEYFSQARIIGIDERPFNVDCCNRLHPRITAHLHQQHDPEVGRIVASFQPDILIDDAGHDDLHQRMSFGMCWPAIRPGGLYIVEDIQKSSYLEFWINQGAKVYANFTSTKYGDYRYDDILAVLRKPQEQA